MCVGAVVLYQILPLSRIVLLEKLPPALTTINAIIAQHQVQAHPPPIQAVRAISSYDSLMNSKFKAHYYLHILHHTF